MAIKNQRTSGPVNAHLTPGPGIYFNAFIHVYSHRAGIDNPLGTNVDVNRKPLSLCTFLVSFKTISLKYDFKHILNDFIHAYSHRARTDKPLGTNFWCQQKALSLCLFVASLKKIALKSDFIYIFYVSPYVMFHHMYIALGRSRQSIGDKILMTTERLFLFAHMLQVSKWSLQNLILYTFLMILYMYEGWSINLFLFSIVSLFMGGFTSFSVIINSNLSLIGKKTLKCKVLQTYDVNITLMKSHVGNVVVKMLKYICGWCTLSGYKCHSTSAIIVKFSDNIWS